MMSDYIKREDALKELLGCVPTDVHEIEDLDVIRVMLALPSADVAPVRHGKWEISMKDYNLYDCSNCHKVTMFETWGGEVKPYGYCPNCGAKMDEEETKE